MKKARAVWPNGRASAAIFHSLKNQAKRGLVINDIHRHPLAYYSIKWLTQLFSKSAMVKFDAPLSVLRAFKKEDLKRILHQAGITTYQLKWKPEDACSRPVFHKRLIPSGNKSHLQADEEPGPPFPM